MALQGEARSLDLEPQYKTRERGRDIEKGRQREREHKRERA